MVSSSVIGFSTTHRRLRTKQNESSLDILSGNKRKDLTEVFFIYILFIIHLLLCVFFKVYFCGRKQGDCVNVHAVS